MKCCNCYWWNNCIDEEYYTAADDEEICENYTPLYPNDEEEYLSDIKLRAKAYTTAEEQGN